MLFNDASTVSLPLIAWKERKLASILELSGYEITKHNMTKDINSLQQVAPSDCCSSPGKKIISTVPSMNKKICMVYYDILNTRISGMNMVNIQNLE